MSFSRGLEGFRKEVERKKEREEKAGKGESVQQYFTNLLIYVDLQS